ncbi:MAG: hypothetical protein DMG49_13490, partial [Acidobacteria bacterium]
GEALFRGQRFLTSWPQNGISLRVHVNPALGSRVVRDFLYVAFSAICLALVISGCNFSSSASPPDTTPPSAPMNLTVTAASASQINLSWTASTDNVGVTGYMVERCTGAACSNFAQIVTPTTTTFNDSGLAASTSYSY